MSTDRDLMTVGELSHKTGVPIKALREYADNGLIYMIGRSQAGYRLFHNDALRCVHWIGALRALGLTIAEIQASTRECLHHADRSPGPHLAGLLDRSRQRAEARIAEQQQILARIEAFQADHGTDPAAPGEGLRWAGGPRSGPCTKTTA